MRRITVFSLALPCVLLGLTSLAAAQNVSIQLTPQGMPIQIPAQGGSFNYTIAATNNGAAPQQATVWCMVTLPNGNPYGPVLGPVTIILNPGQTLDRLRTQNVPAGAPEGNYAFNAHVGVYPNTIWDSDSFAFEKTSAGSELWVARYNGPGNGSDYGRDLALDSDGNICMTGNSEGGCLTIKYDALGNQVWSAAYNGSTNEGAAGYAIALDESDNVYVAGSSVNAANYHFATTKYDHSGNLIWSRIYDGPGNGDDDPYAIAIDGASNVYVTGCSNGIGTGLDYATIKYNSSGTEQWAARYNGPANIDDWAYAMAVDEVGNVYVTGKGYGIDNYADYTTIKYNSEGVEQWIACYHGPVNGDDVAYSIALDASGYIYVTGASTGSGSYTDYATIKYDSAGTEQWVARYNGPANGWDMAASLAVDESRNVYVTGWSYGSGTLSDFATIKYNSSGVEQWVDRYNGPINNTDAAKSLSLDEAGNVYVTGYGDGAAQSYINANYTTIKYNSMGVVQWVACYNGPANGTDVPSSIAVDAGSNVYITGYSYGIGTGSDYCTIKYSGGNIDNWLPVEATVFGQPLPQECRLDQNYPNPFNPTTVLSYQLPVASHVSLQVYDMAGRLVATLVDGWRSAGVHELTWDASDLPSGMYVYRIQARQGASVPGDWTESGKMILLK